MRKSTKVIQAMAMRVNLIKAVLTAAMLLTATCNAQANSTVNAMLANLPSTLQLAFYEPEHFKHVRLIHDTVMGGRSVGNISIADNPPAVIFSGALSLANNGGFASAEFSLAKPLAAQQFDNVYLHALADGRTYQLRLKTPYIPNGVAYVADIKTHTAAEYYYVPVNAFRGQFRGQAVRNLPKLNLADVNKISIMLADKQSGEFTITLYSINFTVVKSI